MSTLLNLLGVPVYLKHTLLDGCFQDVANAQDKNLCENLCKGNTEEKIGLFIVVVLFVRRVIINWGNFASCFFSI